MSDTMVETLSLRDVLDSIADGLFVLDADRRIILFNKGCERLTGYSAEEVLAGPPCSEVTHCQDAQGRSLAGMLCPGAAVFEGEPAALRQRMRIRTRTGEFRWVETQYTCLPDADGQPRHIIGLMRDDAERREFENGLLEGSLNPQDAPSTQPHEASESLDGSSVGSLDERLAGIEREAILAAIRQAGGQRNLAARLMGISRSRLYRRMEALHIDPDNTAS